MNEFCVQFWVVNASGFCNQGPESENFPWELIIKGFRSGDSLVFELTNRWRGGLKWYPKGTIEAA